VAGVAYFLLTAPASAGATKDSPMGFEGQDFGDIAGGVSPEFIETLYARYKTSPESV